MQYKLIDLKYYDDKDFVLIVLQKYLNYSYKLLIFLSYCYYKIDGGRVREYPFNKIMNYKILNFNVIGDGRGKLVSLESLKISHLISKGYIISMIQIQSLGAFTPILDLSKSW